MVRKGLTGGHDDIDSRSVDKLSAKRARKREKLFWRHTLSHTHTTTTHCRLIRSLSLSCSMCSLDASTRPSPPPFQDGPYNHRVLEPRRSLGSVSSTKPAPDEMSPAAMLVGRRAFGGALEYSESGTMTKTGKADRQRPSSREPKFPRERSGDSTSPLRAKEESRPSTELVEEQQPHPPLLAKPKHQQQQQQQEKPKRQRVGRTGGWSTRICNEFGCSTVPSYGAPGTKRQFCLQVDYVSDIYQSS